ncbi:amino acid permease family protein [Companilactobacillus paralimentarius DSM 13238 = JCM 10415]|uniref:Amino acid permease family protein n=1 Tax=Companilactobacillus paralimentarius DSM 13238 = JCM 10415 TaxID=1122151 RepID=A0A0R1PED6_9LACO|nr:amino acid permease [Companilactobacillus paralimentarius]KAE9564432.1 amino acid permease [Companilactobacillus paralimentarius]KRL30813.1 amino acid permease family protein [Companilactobacillus paralimentarius DSM 13238 = JCM 10415]MDR4934741.1 amino acid permease [Companilactobacillus paralimentarius]QFR68872.1 amino acid permease [Companilactobacillus paralimentarius]
MNEKTDKFSLKRDLGFFPALSTVMGLVIGGGVFFKISSVTAATGSASLTIFVWLLAGFITINAGLTVAELASAIPVAGGIYKYIEYIYGKVPAFLLAWAQSVIYYPAGISALSIIFATQVMNLCNISSTWQIPIAISLAIFLYLVNLLGAKVGATIQTVALIAKLIPIALIIIVGIFTPSSNSISLFPITSGSHANFWSSLGGGLLATMFAFDGWMNVGSLAGEMKRPEKDLAKSIIVGLFAITLIYVLISFVFIKELPFHLIPGNQNAASESAIRIFGEVGGKIVTIGILISVFGSVNGYTMTGARVPYVLGTDDEIVFSKFFGKLTKNTRVPANAGLVQTVIAIAMIFMGSFDYLTDMLVFVMWIFSVMMFIGVFILRKKEPELTRPYKINFYPIPPIIALAGGAYIIISTLFRQPGLAAMGIGITLLGLPVYYIHYFNKKRSL